MSPPDTRTALARVRGLGAARSGVQHWWAQRLTAVALVPLSIWWVAGMIAHTGATRVEALAWIARPVNATLTILTLAMVFHHGQLGIQVVIEDYVHHEGAKIALLILIKLLALVLALAGAVAVLQLMLGGAA
jgi:succinate dehydrogenase / fumarate reductase membrane anchor subunit